MKIHSDNGLLFIKVNGERHLLGYLFHAKDVGTFDATHGRVEVSKSQAARHNQLYDRMMLDGLDKNCQVGQGGCFYLSEDRESVRTWRGVSVSDECVVQQEPLRRFSFVWFKRGDKEFLGLKYPRDEDTFEFMRIR